jgi:hypothetical protein
MVLLIDHSTPPKLLLGQDATIGAIELAAGTNCCGVKELLGKRLEVTLQGLSSGDCTNCSGLNNTFLTGATITSSSGCCVTRSKFTSGAGCTALTPTQPGEHWWFVAGMIGSALNDVSIPHPQWGIQFFTWVKSASFTNAGILYRILGATALAEIQKMARGLTATVPFYTHVSTSDLDGVDCAGSLQVYTDNTTSRQCISDTSPVLLSVY